MHDTLESLYKTIGMEVLPDEYLPDDYTGPSAGPLQQIIRTYGHCTNEFCRHSPVSEAALSIAQCLCVRLSVCLLQTCPYFSNQ